MLTKASRCSTKIIQEAAKLVCEREDFLKDSLPSCGNPTEVIKALTASDSWFVLADGQATAVLSLETFERTAAISQICTSDDSFEVVASVLRGELHAMKIANLTLRVPPQEVDRWNRNGFQRGPAFSKFSRTPTVSNMMPLLPLVNATRKELPILSQLLYTAYAKTEEAFFDIQTAEASLRRTMSGARGTYLPDASYASGPLPKLVSACLLTADPPGGAKIDQLFTHPLYRARGLATMEIAAAMNRLAASGVSSLNVWNREGNDVVKRLLGKMGFSQQRTVVEMSTGT